MAGAVAAAGVAGDEEESSPGSIGELGKRHWGGLRLPVCGNGPGRPFISEARRFRGGRG